MSLEFKIYNSARKSHLKFLTTFKHYSYKINVGKVSVKKCIKTFRCLKDTGIHKLKSLTLILKKSIKKLIIKND